MSAVGEQAPQDRLLRMSQVEEVTGLSRRSIYRLIRTDDFPRPYKPGGYASRWSEGEVRNWRESQRERTAND